jgi:hypothetical protein
MDDGWPEWNTMPPEIYITDSGDLAACRDCTFGTADTVFQP